MKLRAQLFFIFFDDRYLHREVFKLMKKYHIFSIFSCFGLFRQVFGQVNL